MDKEQLLRAEVVMSPANGVRVAFWEEGGQRGWMGEKE